VTGDIEEREGIARRLEAMRRQCPDKDLGGSYQAVINRIFALIYRLRTRPRPRIIGLPEGGAPKPKLGE
jgi:hypothetical protein